MIEPAQPSVAGEKAKATSLASRKFDFEDIINADPKCPLPALKIVRAYLRFVTDFEKSAYVSTIDLQVATGLSTRAIIDNRNKLVQLGYFEPDGKTNTGALRFKLKFAREGMVLDHMVIARETLRRIDAERKERQRQKRLSASDRVIEPNAGPETSCDCSSYRDVIEPSAGNYLDAYLESFSYEGESQPLKVNSAPEGDSHLPYPVPATEADATAILEKLAGGHQLSPGVMQVFRRYIMAGTLTPAMVEQQTRFVA